MAVLALSSTASPVPHHAPAEEYAGFLRTYVKNEATLRAFLGARARFIHTYPDLSEWLRAPLAERVGRLRGAFANQFISPVSYKARGYLCFLGLCGYAQFDWEWLIAIPRLEIWHQFVRAGIDMNVGQLIEEAVGLGYAPASASENLRIVVSRIFMHTSISGIASITEAHCRELLEAVRSFGGRPDVALFYGSMDRYRKAVKRFGTSIHCLHVVLFHRAQALTEPRKIMPPGPRGCLLPPSMEAVLEQYASTRSLVSRPATVHRLRFTLRQFAEWVLERYPGIATFAQIKREHVLEFSEALNCMVNKRTGEPLAVLTKRGTMSRLSVFFRDVSSWGWADVPERPLLGIGDLPKMPQRVPRYIPEEELARLMTAIRGLDCPYQRAALLIARWSGARRGEIRRLSIDCLDSYPDGTPRLRIPAGKTRRERLIPLNAEAAAAIQVLQSQRSKQRGFRDDHTGVVTQYLFTHHGKLFSTYYLFYTSLCKACLVAGLVTPDGKPTVTPHRFRHTVGTQLAEKGAKLRTIMSVLGHNSANMSMVYTHISDREVLKDYHAVLGPGVTIAGPYAEAVRAGELPKSAIDWLKSNFFKTELELGHCLRLPQEGPCECDLYLSCAKFVTTPEYAPRLRRRRKQELTLIHDAAAHGWDREVERHQCTVRRIEQLLAELGESMDGEEATV
jgi:integrase